MLYEVLYGIIHGGNLPYVVGSPCFPPLITTDDVEDTLPDGAVDQYYGAALSATGGVEPYHWEAVLSADLPPGLTLDFSSGVIDGYPTLAGTYSFEVKITDSLGMSHTKMLSITIFPITL